MPEVSDDELLGYGVPPEWLEDVRDATEDNVLASVPTTCPPRLPKRCSSWPWAARLNPPLCLLTVTDPFDHPDALRRFRVMGDMEELLRALEYPWEKWTVFLHPEQRRFATGDYNGPARVSGSAGTGKTVVALHRAIHLAKTNPESRSICWQLSPRRWPTP